MKAIRFMEPEVIEYSAVATPEPKDNEVLAQIAYAGFCATDIELLTGDTTKTALPSIPSFRGMSGAVPSWLWAGTFGTSRSATASPLT